MARVYQLAIGDGVPPSDPLACGALGIRALRQGATTWPLEAAAVLSEHIIARKWAHRTTLTSLSSSTEA
jgi:hypothetical protein